MAFGANTMYLAHFTAGNEFSASTTLNDFLRQKRVSMGTKVMCKQGGCGICIVEAKMSLGTSPRKVSAAVNSVSLVVRLPVFHD